MTTEDDRQPAPSLRDLARSRPAHLQPPPPGTPRAAILDAARELFAARGFAATTTRSIAERAGVNLAMIHYYWGNKEQLYRRVIALEFVDMFRIVSEGVAEDASPDALLVGIPEFARRLHAEHPRLMPLLLREMADGAPRLPQLVEELGDFGPRGLRRVLGEAVDAARGAGLADDLPPAHLLAIIMSISNGPRAFAPLFAILFELDLDDPEATAALTRSVQRVLARALTPDGGDGS